MYKDLIKDKKIYSLNIPKTIVPSPTDDDYSNGVIDRFFTQKVNDYNGFVYEINSDTYNVNNTPNTSNISYDYNITNNVTLKIPLD